ncbi:hypothetical protein C900_02149 [Fulvivirga imtechensis AK7]|uniref:Uncharacterized protein n=1 Tax=Fulvivirga imtechensis AK7 TaxID=1237149 RepID=L8JSS9_9BACT|nr:hypothetical protein C900_02149 [Fulvivirga imtechensis AK7]
MMEISCALDFHQLWKGVIMISLEGPAEGIEKFPRTSLSSTSYGD